MLRTVMFDLDDTLVDQETAAREAVLAWAEELGVRDPDVGRRWAAVSERHYRAAGIEAVLLDRHDVHPDVDVPRVRSLHDLVLAG